MTESAKLRDRRKRARVAPFLFLAAFLAAVAGWFVVPPVAHGSVRAVASFDASAIVVLVVSWIAIVRSDAERTRRRAAAYDPGRAAVSVIAVCVSAFSLFAALFALRRVFTYEEGAIRTFFLGLTLAAIALSWAVTHTTFTFRYAHLYYGAGRGEGGLNFPGEDRPDEVDFAYFAFTLGMTFQTSDVTIASSRIRRTTLAHALLSFVYNTVIVALSVNLAVNVLGR